MLKHFMGSPDYVILDFSAMFVDIDADTSEFLNSMRRIHVAPTFDCECRHVYQCAPRHIQARYRLNNQNISDLDVRRADGLMDTYGLIEYLRSAYPDASICVIAANYALCDRIVLNHLNVEFYNVLSREYVAFEDHGEQGISAGIVIEETPLEYVPVQSGSNVYTPEGPLVLDERQSGGAEADLYSLKNRAGIIAKIFKENEDEDDVSMLTQQKLDNISILCDACERWNLSWLALPSDIVYADAECTKPIGYTMRRFENVSFFSANDLFNNGMAVEKMEKYPHLKVADVLNICICFVRQLLFLSINDIRILDFNDANFALSGLNGNRVYMVDTDSYCYNDYICRYPTYKNGLGKSYSLERRLDFFELCDASLCAFVFVLLSLYTESVPMVNGSFRYAGENLKRAKTIPAEIAKWNSMPSNLKRRFEDVFVHKKNPCSMSELLFELEKALNDSFAQKEYRELYAEVIQNTEAAKKQKEAEAKKDAEKKSPSNRPGTAAGARNQTQKTAAAAKQPDPPAEPPKKKHWFGKLMLAFANWMFVFMMVLTFIGYWVLLGHPQLTMISKVQFDGGSYWTPFGGALGYYEYEWDDGKKYRGMLRDGKIDGWGVYEWANGDKYFGQFKDNKLVGYSLYADLDGIKMLSYFPEIFQTGDSIMLDENGKLFYKGGVRKGLFDGEGEYYFPNGEVYQATWSDGTVAEGAMLEVSRGEPFFKGYWKKNVFYGEYYDDGTWKALP